MNSRKFNAGTRNINYPLESNDGVWEMDFIVDHVFHA